MKEIIAVIRPEKWMSTKAHLMSLGATSFNTQRVYGHGRGKGLKYGTKAKPKRTGVTWLPKRLVTIWAEDDQVETIVQALIGANQTGSPGDGKIFICPLRNALRISTGEQGASAI